MADASYRHSAIHIERYQRNVMSKGHQILFEYDQLLQKEKDSSKQMTLKHEATLPSKWIAIKATSSRGMLTPRASLMFAAIWKAAAYSRVPSSF